MNGQIKRKLWQRASNKMRKNRHNTTCTGRQQGSSAG